jgi:hypothetical protein
VQNFELTVHECTRHPLKYRYYKNDNLDDTVLIFSVELRKVGKAASYAEEREDVNLLWRIGMVCQSPDWETKWGRNAGKPTSHNKIMFGAVNYTFECDDDYA